MTEVEDRIAYVWQIYRVKQRLKSEDLPNVRQQLLELFEQRRGQWRSRAGRLWDSQDRDERMVDALRGEMDEKPDGELAFSLVESSKSRTLLDQMSHSFRDVSDATRGEVLDLEKNILRFAQQTADGVLLQEMQLASHIPVLPAFDSEEKVKLLQKLEQLYEAEDAGFSKVIGPLSLSKVQAQLQPDELLIEYSLPYQFGRMQSLWALCITKNSLHTLQIPMSNLEYEGRLGFLQTDGKPPIEMSGLGDLVVMARTEIQRGRMLPAAAKLRELYDLVIEPVVTAGFDPKQFARWIIVPAGALHGAPFGALVDKEGVPLYERVALVTAPSASVWASSAARQMVAPTRMISFADPTFSPEARLPALPNARVEVKAIKNLLLQVHCETFCGEEATEARFIGLSHGADLIHLATHATFPEQDAIDLHRLAFAPGGGQDGELRAEEIRKLDLSSASLVVLSVCNGGIYRFGPGNELHGLIAAFLAAGARNVLATLWSVQDKAAREFMVLFYSKLFASGAAEALRQAAIEVRNQGAPISQWASFVLVGDGRPWKS